MKSHLAEILSAALGVAVMCTPAHAKAPPGRFVVGVDPGINGGFPVVFDSKTKLTWQQGFTGPFAANDPSRSSDMCRQLDFGATDTTGWRLPTVKELLTLIDYAAPLTSIGPPARVDATFFPDTPGAGFWSTTSSPSFPLQCVSFGSGSLGCSDVNYVRCVR